MKKATEIGGRNIIYIMLYQFLIADITNTILHIILYHNISNL